MAGLAPSDSSNIVRVGAVQWCMRPFESAAALVREACGQVATIADYGADFAVFPEMFTLPLLRLRDLAEPRRALAAVAQESAAIRDALAEAAARHKVNVIAGSMPVMRDGGVRNTSWLLHRDGRIDVQEKLHPTPGEVSRWDIRGGDRLSAFDTDAGRVGILVCYDVEFPELGRLLMEAGAEVVFVPSWTDLRSGYMRVRLCAQARAVENECYVVLTGSCGALPGVPDLGIQYSQAAAFSPCDIGFPPEGVVAQIEPNDASLLIADLDVARLVRLRAQGAVRNRRDRRNDLYEVRRLRD